jgi:hypothetical protein
MHVQPKRLFELAQIENITQHTEWEHIRDCDICGSRFIQFIRQSVEANKNKSVKRTHLLEDSDLKQSPESPAGGQSAF